MNRKPGSVLKSFRLLRLSFASQNSVNTSNYGHSPLPSV